MIHSWKRLTCPIHVITFGSKPNCDPEPHFLLHVVTGIDKLRWAIAHFGR
jgi:hypothetical protein